MPIFKLIDIFLLVVKCTWFVLLKFRDNWFAPNHLFKVAKTMWMFLLKSIWLEWSNKILVSNHSIFNRDPVNHFRGTHLQFCDWILFLTNSFFRVFLEELIVNERVKRWCILLELTGSSPCSPKPRTDPYSKTVYNFTSFPPPYQTSRI
jgi:hypothetical protein